MDIQWFPGHMAKTKRIITEYMKAVDLVIETIDARIPASSSNPVLNELIGKKKLIVLNKADLAEPEYTQAWLEMFQKSDIPAIAISSSQNDKKVRDEIIRIIESKVPPKFKMAKKKNIRVMVVGIPNVGKSSIINFLSEKKMARVENRPGVTRGVQWAKINENVALLDMPGVLMPKISTELSGKLLALTGAIKTEIFDQTDIAKFFVETVLERKKNEFAQKYSIDYEEQNTVEAILHQVGEKRGCILPGGKYDELRIATLLLNEYRKGLYGRYTLERP